MNAPLGSAAKDRARHWPLALALGVAVLSFTRVRASLPLWVDLHRWLAELGLPAAVRNLDASLLLVLAAIAGAAIVAPRRPLQALGLRGSIAFGAAFGVGVALPMLAVGAISGDGVQLDGRAARGALLAPFVEEAFFRGLLVAIPVAIGGVPFWPAAIGAGLLFGAAHVSWTAPAWSDAPTLAVTAAGGIWYAWLVRTFAWNLWTTVFLHAAMNAAWLVFAVGGGAVGGAWPNVGRVATIALGTAIALRHRRRAQRAVATTA